MDATTNAASDSTLRSRARISHALVTLAVLLLVGGVAYYGLSVLRASTFGKERAFRVLGEVAEQIQNLQGNLVGLLGNVPDRLKRCSGKGCDDDRGRFARKLDLKVQLQSVAIRAAAYRALCGVDAGAPAFLLHASEPNVPFKLFSCSAAQNAAPDAATVQVDVGLTGELTPSAEAFISQSFFDEVVLALQDGRVLAEVPQRARSLTAGAAPLHDSKVRLLSITDAGQLLHRASTEAARGGAEDAKAPAAADVSLHPVVFSERLAGQNYSVFVVGFRLAYPTVAVNAGAEPGQQALFLIGLKRVDLRADIVSALGPSGTFVVTIVIALLFFSFPLLSLRLKPLRDPIAWGEAAGCVLSLVLLAALLAIAATWIWSQQELLRWADDAAREYAIDIRRRLVDELGNDAVILGQYRDVMYRDTDRNAESAERRVCADSESFRTAPMPLRAVTSQRNPNEDTYAWPQLQLGERSFASAEGMSGDDACNTLQLRAIQPLDGLKSWSPLRSNFALLADGKTAGPRITTYAVVPVRRDLELKDRAYFRAIEREGQWQLPVTGGVRDFRPLEFVAQRLFNRGDGARVLQIAVPRTRDGAFDGLISGDTRAHGLTAAVAPLFLKFAVIDREGAVLFHWDDSRSVTENFLVEAERNSMLQSAVSRQQAGYVAGNYSGVPHRFFYLPLRGVPWGVVAFYPESSVLELASQAGISALVAYAAIVLLFALAIVVATVIVGKAAMKAALVRLWPRKEARHAYEMWGVAAAISALGFMLLFCWPNGEWGRGVAAGVAVLLGTVLVLACRYWPGHAYAMCVSSWLIFVAAVPATGIALCYHDAQIEALVRSGFSGALDEIERRHQIIAHDLRRWESNAAVRARDLPDAWTLAEHASAAPVAGYRLAPIVSSRSERQTQWAMISFATPPWAFASWHRGLGDWLQFIWRETAANAEQQRRSDLLHDTRSTDNWSLVTSDGRALAVKAEWRTAAVSANVATNAWPWLQDVLAAVVAMVLILCSSSLVCRRLLGSHVSWPHRYSGRDVLPDSPSTVIYYRSDSPDIDAVIARITAMINLATDARFASVQPLTIGPGTYRFDDLDLAVIEPARRVQILAVLERLIDRHDVELIITANRSPLRRLHRPEMYPEFRPGDEAGYAELIRWDSVMGRFRELLQPAVPPSQAALPTAKLADFHRTWKLCTRDERLILHQLATGKLANPEHADTIGILIRYGLVCVDPLPRICDPDFSRFVRTAEAPGDIALWQHEASRSTWKSLRAPVVAGLMLLVLMLVVWFSWAGGESFKVFSTVIMAAVALLGHLTNAFNFVRGPASKT